MLIRQHLLLKKIYDSMDDKSIDGQIKDNFIFILYFLMNKS